MIPRHHTTGLDDDRYAFRGEPGDVGSQLGAARAGIAGEECLAGPLRVLDAVQDRRSPDDLNRPEVLELRAGLDEARDARVSPEVLHLLRLGVGPERQLPIE